MKRRIKIIVDIAMFLLFLYLLSYRPGMGLKIHAEFGIALFVLFLIHHGLNAQWYRTLGKGRYNFRRLLLTGSDFLLLAAMLCMMASSFMLSGMVFPAVGIRMTHEWRQLHVSASAWCFLLMAFHVGMHLHGMFQKLQRKMRQTAFEYVYDLFLFAVAGLGIYCFVKSGMWPRVVMAEQQSLFIADSRLFLAEHFGIVAGISVITHWILWVAEWIKRKNGGKENADKKVE